MKENENEEKNSHEKEVENKYKNLINIKKTKKISTNNINNISLSPTKEENQSYSSKHLESFDIANLKNIIKNASVYDILGIKNKDKKNYDKISSEFKKYEKRFNINISYYNKNDLKFENPIEISKIINILSLPSEKRTFDDIFLMKKYLLTTKIENLFKDEFNNKEESIDKLLTFFGLEMKYRLFEKDEVVFRIGDLSVYLFLIIEGKVEVLKPITEIKNMTGYEYFSYLLDLKNNSEHYLFNLSIEENLKAYDIEKSDFDQLPYIYILNLLEKLKFYQYINFEEELEFLNIEPEELDLDSSKIKSKEYIFLRIKQIKSKLADISSDKIKKYKFIVDHNKRKQVKLYKYMSFLKLDKNSFFGESAMGTNEKRNATIKVSEDSYLGYLSASLYKTNFFAEKKLVTENKMNFLHSKFFFNKISLKRFAKKYFNLFISESFINGNIIFNETEPINFVYFIEEGMIELSSSKTILEIEIFLEGLQNRISLDDGESQLIYKKISSNTEDLKTYLNKTQKNRILIVGKSEILGLESFYYNIPYFTTARVISSRAKIFKIDAKQLIQILKIEVDCLADLKNLVFNKIKILKKRFFRINNTKISLIDEKINSYYKDIYHKHLVNKNRILENEIINNQKNNVLYNEVQIKTLFKPRTKRDNFFPNIDSSLEKNETKKKKNKKIFTLYENNDINISSGFKKLNNSSEQEKGIHAYKNEIENIKKKTTFLEDKLLNKIKTQIRLMNNNKYFLSQIKIPINKNNTNDINEEGNNDKKNSDDDNNNKNINDLDISNNKDENNNMINIYSKKSFNDNLFDTQIQFKKNNSNNNDNSISSMLPSIFSAGTKRNKNLHRSLSFVNDRNNYSCSINVDKSIYKNSISPNNDKSTFSFLSERNNKNIYNKKFIGLNVEKFANFYEIKNNYQKQKFRFYNNSEIFGYKKKEELKTFEIKNIKPVKDDFKGIKIFNPKLHIKNKEIISKLKKHKDFNIFIKEKPK